MPFEQILSLYSFYYVQLNFLKTFIRSRIVSQNSTMQTLQSLTERNKTGTHTTAVHMLCGLSQTENGFNIQGSSEPKRFTEPVATQVQWLAVTLATQGSPSLLCLAQCFLRSSPHHQTFITTVYAVQCFPSIIISWQLKNILIYCQVMSGYSSISTGSCRKMGNALQESRGVKVCFI